MSRVSCTVSRLACAAVFTGMIASAAAAQVPAPAKPDCQKMMATMNHAAMGQMDHAAMMKECGGAMPMAAGMAMPMGGGMAMGPSLPGQAAFGAIGEIVRILEHDPATDWSKVNIEALRQHFIDMDEVTLRSRVAQRQVPGGFSARVTGGPATAAAIRRMLSNHAATFDAASGIDARTNSIPAGVALTVVARDPADSALVARLRGLGVFGFLAEGEHHSQHHLAIARGDAMAHMH